MYDSLFYLIKSHNYIFPTHFHGMILFLMIAIYQFVKSPFRGWLPQGHCQFVGAVLWHLLIKGNIQMNSIIIILCAKDNVRLDLGVVDMIVGFVY